MRVGLIQFFPAFGQIRKNLSRALFFAHWARKRDLVILPELFSTGYQFRSKRELGELSEPILGGPTSIALARWCRERGTFLVAGMAEQSGNRCFNSAALFGPSGFLGTYRKTHLFWDEKKWFAPGDTGFRAWRAGSLRLGIMICFDWFFPEAARALALRGADLITHPSNLVLPFHDLHLHRPSRETCAVGNCAIKRYNIVPPVSPSSS